MSEWIKVKDKLPDLGERGYSDDVLVFELYTGQYTAYLNKNGWHPIQDAFDAENYDGGATVRIACPEDITHWKPLGPDPDKE